MREMELRAFVCGPRVSACGKKGKGLGCDGVVARADEAARRGLVDEAGRVCEEDIGQDTTEGGYCQVLYFISTVRMISCKCRGSAREVEEKKEVRRKRVARGVR